MSDTRLLVKNTFALYIRMAVTILIGLYTSRVVLNVLGVEDYGLYGVVGGVVSMFGFLNATMSSATSRFLAFELGKGNFKNLSDTFSSAMIGHIIIVIVVIVLSETVGLWLLLHKLVIPENRMTAVLWVYQLSVLSVCFSFTQVPYNASIIAHEKMEVYAYVEMLNAVLKLVIVLLLQSLNGDRLIIYAVLVLSVSVFIMMVYRIYCFKNYPETHFHFIWDVSILKPLLSFSGWDLYGNFSGVMRQQGVNIVINMFFGPILNAASSIATMVSGLIMQFATNIAVALKPRIIKSYANKQYDEVVNLVRIGYIVFFILLTFISVPLMCEMHYVLVIWLKVVPDYAVTFCQLLLLFNILSSPSHAILPAIHATGNIKWPSIIMGTLYIMVVPVSFLAFRYGVKSPLLPYIINVTAVCIGMLSNAFILSKRVNLFSYKCYLKDFVFKMVVPLTVCVLATCYLTMLMQEGLFRLLITVCFSSIVIISLSYFYIIPSDYRKRMVELVKIRLCRGV